LALRFRQHAASVSAGRAPVETRWDPQLKSYEVPTKAVTFPDTNETASRKTSRRPAAMHGTAMTLASRAWHSATTSGRALRASDRSLAYEPARYRRSA
jgi:hypothetical protein